ncbi:MAG: FecR domain-containing protein [Candidatus Eisenbacteria bacterium]
MTGHETPNPEAARARDAVRELPRPVADPAFRARLRQEFMSGTIAPALPVRALVVPLHRRPVFRWGGAALAVAAAFVVVSLLNRAPAWRMNAVTGSGIVIVDGVPVPTAHAADLERRLRAGALIQVPAGVEIEIASRGQFAVQFSPGTEASVPRVPGRWFGRLGSAEIRSGELRVTTGAAFRGALLAIETPEAKIEVTGTTFAVICEAAGTCLCVLDGRVRIGARGAPAMVEVPGGRRRFVFADGREEEAAEMRHTEHGPLGEFQERMGRELGAKSAP